MSLVSLTDTATEALAELPLSGPCHTRDEAAHHKDSKETKCILPLKKMSPICIRSGRNLYCGGLD